MRDFDFDSYRKLDASNARPARLNPKIKQLQDNLGIQAPPKEKFFEQFDRDVREIIMNHDSASDRKRLNMVIRAMFA